MTDLASRLREAKEGSRELDRDIAIALFVGSKDNAEYARRAVVSHGAKPHHYEVVGISGISLHTPEPVTTGLSAAVALCERALPGWEFGLDVGYHNEERICAAYVGDPVPRDDNDYWSFPSRAATPALALCLAILTAKEKANDRD